MAAARQVLIKCGFTEIDGHVFCLGLEYLNKTLQIPMNPVTFLIRQAIFRSRHIPRTQERLSLNICSLGELVDMYHAHEATEPLDKVYALLGMCSDDLTTAGLRPDYTIQWGELSQKLIKFLFGHNISVETSNNIQTAVIKTKGCVLGRVFSARSKNDLGNRQDVEAVFKVRSMQSGTTRDGNTHWTLRITSKSIQYGDIVCFLEGARKPTIIRVIENYSAIIISTAAPPKHIRTGNGDIEWAEFIKTASFTRDFLLVWDWKVSLKNLQHPGKYDVLIQTDNRQSQPTKMEFADSLDDAIRTWNIVQILGDAEVFKEAEEKKQKATEVFQTVVRKEHLHSLECSCGQVPLLWAAENGDDAVVGMLLAKDDVDLKIKDYSGQTPLSWAAKNGHEAVVKLLLEAGKVDVDSKGGKYGRTPLSWAAGNGHEAVVKLLLETGKVDADSKDSEYGQTPLSWAAGNGHEAVVKLLLETGKVDVDSKDSEYGQRPLLRAARNGHEAVVKLLLETGKVDVDLKGNYYGQTPLSWAARNGHEAAVKLLLDTGKVDADSKDSEYGQTPLSWAAGNGHEAVVKLLLETGKVDVDSKDSEYGQRPLLRAARNGHEAVVKLLLETGKVDVD